MGSGQEYFANLERMERFAEEQRWAEHLDANPHRPTDEVRAEWEAAERVRKQLLKLEADRRGEEAFHAAWKATTNGR
jgi:hypothetical protein